MAPRAWKTWLLRFAGFIGLVLSTIPASHWLGLDYWQPLINNQALKIYLYQRDSLVPDVLFLGTSKTNRAVIPELVETECTEAGAGPVTAFCLGQRGASAQIQWMVLRDVLECDGNPRLVVLEVTPGMLNANHSGYGDALRHYASPADLALALPDLRTADQWRAAGRGLFRGMTSLYLRVWCLLLRDGQERQLSSIKRLKGAHYPAASAATNERLDRMTAEEREALLRTMRRQGRRLFMREYRIGGAPAEGLEKIISLARRRGIGLVLFNPPVTRDYRRALYGDGVRDRYLEYLEAISRREEIPFHDLDDGRLFLSEEDYFDFGHLNAAGARKLSRYLARELIRPALEPPPVPNGRVKIRFS